MKPNAKGSRRSTVPARLLCAMATAGLASFLMTTPASAAGDGFSDVSFAVSGSPGAWLLNFTVTALKPFSMEPKSFIKTFTIGPEGRRGSGPAVRLHRNDDGRLDLVERHGGRRRAHTRQQSQAGLPRRDRRFRVARDQRCCAHPRWLGACCLRRATSRRISTSAATSMCRRSSTRASPSRTS